jgi:hypothetical protein
MFTLAFGRTPHATVARCSGTIIRTYTLYSYVIILHYRACGMQFEMHDFPEVQNAAMMHDVLMRDIFLLLWLPSVRSSVTSRRGRRSLGLAAPHKHHTKVFKSPRSAGTMGKITRLEFSSALHLPLCRDSSFTT